MCLDHSRVTICPAHLQHSLRKTVSSDIWIGDSDESCHMTNNATEMYCVRPPPSDQWEVITSDGTRLRVEYIRNIDVVFHKRSDEPITLCDVSYVPGLRFIF